MNKISIEGGPLPRGIFSYVLQVISNLYAIDKTDTKIVVNLTNTPYIDNNKGPNCWNYYFYQPFSDSEISNATSSAVWLDNHLMIPPILTTDIISKSNYLISKYIKPKQHILDIKKAFKDNIIQTDNYAAIHFRGTDHIQDAPILDKQIYLDEIQKIYNHHDKILVCSDEADFIQLVKRTFGSKIINYPSFLPVKNIPVHFNNSAAKYKSGEDVIIESYLMSESKFLIRTTSNVTHFSILNNLNLNYSNIDDLTHYTT